MKLFSELGDKLGQSALIVISLHYMRKDQALTMIAALSIGTALTNLLKAFWHEPRPYLLSADILPAKCKAIEYGMPSGHTMGFMLVYRTFVKMINHRLQPALEFTVFIFCLLVAFNRAQMQVHSFDQLLDGFFMGVLGSSFLSEPEVRQYMITLCHKINTFTLYELFTERLCLIFLTM